MKPPDDGMLLNRHYRAFLRGENDVMNPDDYRHSIRSDVRKRFERLHDELDMLEAAGMGDLVDEFYAEFQRSARLQRRVEELEALVLDEE